MAIKGSCHCGATQFEVSAAPENVTRCTCSFCSKRGALWAYYTPAEFKLLTARDRVSTYQWQHLHGPPSLLRDLRLRHLLARAPDWSTGKPDFDNPRIGVNARLFDDFDLDAVEVVTIDGKNLW